MDTKALSCTYKLIGNVICMNSLVELGTDLWSDRRAQTSKLTPVMFYQ